MTPIRQQYLHIKQQYPNTIVFFRTLKGQFTARRHLAVEAASIYWHFVDVVWICLVITIYVVH